jgi:hypothetical protein
MTLADDLRSKVSELCVDGVLNCIKESVTIGYTYPLKSIRGKISSEVLRYYWALTQGVENIAKTVILSPRRMTSAIDYELVEREGIITGALDASATILAQMRTLDPTIFVVNEPKQTYESEPNHLVAWLLKEALDILLSARRLCHALNNMSWFNRKVSLLENALRNDVLRQVLLSPLGRRKPNRSTLRVAAKSRVVLYQEALSVYHMLERIEIGDVGAIRQCLATTLVADLENWQRLELGTGLKVASAISRAIKEPVRLNFPFISGRPIANIGPYEVYWQYAIPTRPEEKLDNNERWIREITDNIGISTSDSRADVAVTLNGAVQSIFECKYSESESAPAQAVVDATSQIVRYARDLHPDSIADAEKFLEKCYIIVADCNKYAPKHSNPATETDRKNRHIYFSDIKNLLNNSLDSWAKETIVV